MSAHDARVLRLELQKNFHELRWEDFEAHPVWGYVPSMIADPEGPVAPVILKPERLVPFDADEVWCLCEAEFANGQRHQATALCEANGHTGPLAISVRCGEEYVGLLTPPAPEFALSKEGPAVFATRFGLPLSAVFPVSIRVLAEFEDPPRNRSAVYSVDGRA